MNLVYISSTQYLQFIALKKVNAPTSELLIKASSHSFLIRFPAKEIHASRKALQGTEKECLRMVWETGTSGLWKVDGVNVLVAENGFNILIINEYNNNSKVDGVDVVVEEGKDEGWTRIEQIIDEE